VTKIALSAPVAFATPHPFKEGVKALINKHFASEIARNFMLIFEWEKYNPKISKNTWKQKKDNMPIMEVYYTMDSGLTQYICDLFPWDSKPKTEARLLRYITDKAKIGQLGADWDEMPDGRIGKAVTEGKFETLITDPTDPLFKEEMQRAAKKKGKKK